jgi:hypothetical protein
MVGLIIPVRLKNQYHSLPESKTKISQSDDRGIILAVGAQLLACGHERAVPRIGQIRTVSSERLGELIARVSPDVLAHALEGLGEICG